MRSAPRGRRVTAVVISLLAIVGSVLVAAPAQAATLSLTSTRVTSGTTPNAASSCPTQGTPTAADHCAGFDTSSAATDQILRTGDTAQVRFDFATSGAAANLQIVATLPAVDNLPVATWAAAVPTSCLVGSTVSDAGRTLACKIADPGGASNGTITASLTMATQVADGETFSIEPVISADQSGSVTATGDTTFTASTAPFYNLNKSRTTYFNRLPAPFAYKSPTGEAGIAVPTSTTLLVNGVGGYEPLRGPVTWSETPATTPAGVRLLDWGNYGNGCGSQSRASKVTNPGYTGTAVPISNQMSASVNALLDCSQPGGAGSPVQVSWTNPPTRDTSALLVNAWIMLWVPVSALPTGTSTFTVTAGDFDPTGVTGTSNYLGDEQPVNDDFRQTGSIVNSDANTFVKSAVADTNPIASTVGSGVGTVARGARFQTS